MKEFKVEEHFNAANSFKPWKKNFLAECLKCESMSRPTDDQNSVLSLQSTQVDLKTLEKQTFNHLLSIKLDILDQEVIDDSEMSFIY